MTSRPSKSAGIVAAWMADGVSYPTSLQGLEDGVVKPEVGKGGSGIRRGVGKCMRRHVSTVGPFGTGPERPGQNVTKYPSNRCKFAELWETNRFDD